MTKAGLIGTIVEEGSHVIGKVEGRQRKTGTDEKGLESTGRASNEYFAEKYKDDNETISIQSDGKDYSNVDFGENVGDEYLGKKIVDSSFLTLREVRKDYKNQSDISIREFYGFSVQEIQNYVEKYMKTIKNVDEVVKWGIAISLSNPEAVKVGELKDLKEKVLSKLGSLGLRIISALPKKALIDKIEKWIEKYTKKESKLPDIKEQTLIAAGYRENERYHMASQKAGEDERYLLPIVTKNLVGLSPSETKNICKGGNICIDYNKFKAKYAKSSYPNNNYKIAVERLSRFVNFYDSYSNFDIKARVNYYLLPGKLKNRPFSNK